MTLQLAVSVPGMLKDGETQGYDSITASYTGWTEVVKHMCQLHRMPELYTRVLQTWALKVHACITGRNCGFLVRFVVCMASLYDFARFKAAAGRTKMIFRPLILKAALTMQRPWLKCE